MGMKTIAVTREELLSKPSFANGEYDTFYRVQDYSDVDFSRREDITFIMSITGIEGLDISFPNQNEPNIYVIDASTVPQYSIFPEDTLFFITHDLRAGSAYIAVLKEDIGQIEASKGIYFLDHARQEGDDPIWIKSFTYYVAEDSLEPPRNRFEQWLFEIINAFKGAAGSLVPKSNMRFERWLDKIRSAAYEAGQGGSSITLASLEVNSAGTFTPPTGYAYNEVNVPQGSFTITPKVEGTLGDWRITAEFDSLSPFVNGYATDGSIRFNEEVFDPIDYVNYDSLTITSNGVYDPRDSGLDFFDMVEVDVPLDIVRTSLYEDGPDEETIRYNCHCSSYNIVEGAAPTISGFGFYPSELLLLGFEQTISTDASFSILDITSNVSIEFIYYDEPVDEPGITLNQCGFRCDISRSDPYLQEKESITSSLLGKDFYFVLN